MKLIFQLHCHLSDYHKLLHHEQYTYGCIHHSNSDSVQLIVQLLIVLQHIVSIEYIKSMCINENIKYDHNVGFDLLNAVLMTLRSYTCTIYMNMNLIHLQPTDLN